MPLNLVVSVLICGAVCGAVLMWCCTDVVSVLMPLNLVVSVLMPLNLVMPLVVSVLMPLNLVA